MLGFSSFNSIQNSSNNSINNRSNVILNSGSGSELRSGNNVISSGSNLTSRTDSQLDLDLLAIQVDNTPRMPARQRMQPMQQPMMQRYCPDNKVYELDGTTMGGAKDGSTLKLTGRELEAIHDILGDDNTLIKAQDMVDKLKDKGIQAEIADNGVDVMLSGDRTIHDCDGNGALNTKDYDFNTALTDFQKDMDTYKENLEQMYASRGGYGSQGYSPRSVYAPQSIYAQNAYNNSRYQNNYQA